MRSNPVRDWDRSGLVEEEDDKLEEPTLEDIIAESQVSSLTESLRQYNADFQYSIVGPPGTRYSQLDVAYLRQLLQNYRSQNSCRGTPSPALKDSPYSPNAVDARVRPPYKVNPAHDPNDPNFNPQKTPEPADSQSVYQTASRGDLGVWYGLGQGGWYRYFSDNAGTVHFSGIVSENEVPISIRRGQ